MAKVLLVSGRRHVICQLPLMELPPLSPGIQDSVMVVVVVLVTVRRGWSGTTSMTVERKTNM